MSLIRRSKFKDYKEERDIAQLFDWINSQSDIVTFTVVTPGTAVVVHHSLEYVPRLAIPIVTWGAGGNGVVYPGGAAWTTTTISLTATIAGNYTVLIRR